MECCAVLCHLLGIHFLNFESEALPVKRVRNDFEIRLEEHSRVIAFIPIGDQLSHMAAIITGVVLVTEMLEDVKLVLARLIVGVVGVIRCRLIPFNFGHLFRNGLEA